MLWPTTHEEAERLKQEAAQERKRDAKINLMHKAYGVVKGKKCKDCAHFVRKEFANTYFKCDLVGMKGINTDWRAGFEACGKWESCSNSGMFRKKV